MLRPYADFSTAVRVHLVGTNHRHQIVGCPEGNQEAFARTLSELAVKLDIALIAEELNEEAFDFWQGIDSVARQVAIAINAQHKYCDPTRLERVNLGIPTSQQIAQSLGFGRVITSNQQSILDSEMKKYWPIREQYWLRCLVECQYEDALFILGSDHIETFTQLLQQSGHQAIIAHTNCGHA